MKNALMTLEDKKGRLIQVRNQSADEYRINQMLSRGFMPAGELCCRLGIPLIGSERNELRITQVLQ